MSNIFKEAVEDTDDIKEGYRPGLQALGEYSKHISANNSNIDGSVDIDTQTKNMYPDSSRWDYAIGYNDKAYFVEVHPATTSEVSTVINKLKWLKDWLKQKASQLKAISSNEYYWIPSGKCDIRDQHKKMELAKSGMKVASRLTLK